MNQQIQKLRELLTPGRFNEGDSQFIQIASNLERDYEKMRFKMERTNHDKQVIKNVLSQTIKDLQEKNSLLEEEKRLLIQKSTEKEKVFESVAHELRNPINGILGMVDLLDANELEPQIASQVTAIKGSTENVRVIVEDVLTLANLNASTFSLRKDPFDSRSIFEELEMIMKTANKEKNLQLEIQNNCCWPDYLIGDKTRLFQIVSNLLSNAIKYTNEGSIQLHADYEELSPGMVKLIFEIKDSGIGIPIQKISSIYNKYTQVNKDTGDGLGLGLNIVKNLVDKMEGYVEVESKEGEGSVFRIVVPMIVPSTKMVEGYQKGGLNKDRIKFWKDKRILIIEDCATSLIFAEELLKNWGIKAKTAKSLKKANALLDLIQFDCILLDYNLPDGKSNNLIKSLQDGNGKNCNTPIIITSGAQNYQVDAKLDGGRVAGFVRKPYYPDDLAIVLFSVYKNQHVLYGNKPGFDPNTETIGHSTRREHLDRKKKFIVNKNVLREMKSILMKEAPISLAKMENAIKRGYWSKLSLEAHKIKSTIKYCGLESIGRNLDRIEELCKSPNTVGYIEHEFYQIKSGLLRALIMFKKEHTYKSLSVAVY